MTMLQATIKCLRKYATFKGRASKREYWWFVLFAFLFEWPYFLITLPSQFTIPFTSISIDLFGETDPVNGFLKYFYFTACLFLIIPQWAVWTRRMHDTNHSGWSWLLVFIPIIGWFIILRRLLRRGDEGSNDYGPPHFGITPQKLTEIESDSKPRKKFQRFRKQKPDPENEINESDGENETESAGVTN